MRRKFFLVLRIILISSLFTGVLYTATIVGLNFLFQIRTVTVVGDRDLFRDVAFLRQKRNLLFLDEQQFHQEIKQAYTGVKSVTLQKNYPSALTIIVEKREPVLMSWHNAEPIYLDEQGVIVRTVESLESRSLPTLQCSFELLESLPPFVVHAAELVRKVQSFTDVVEVICIDDRSYQLKLTQTEIMISVDQTVTEIASSLQFLLNQFRIEGKIPEVVDLRFGKAVLIPDMSQVITTAPASESSASAL